MWKEGALKCVRHVAIWPCAANPAGVVWHRDDRQQFEEFSCQIYAVLPFHPVHLLREHFSAWARDGLNADMRKGFEMLIAAKYQALGASGGIHICQAHRVRPILSFSPCFALQIAPLITYRLLERVTLLKLCASFTFALGSIPSSFGVLEDHINRNTFLNCQYDWAGLMGRDLDS